MGRGFIVWLAALFALLAGGQVARAAQVTDELRFQASDGVELAAKLGGEGSLQPRPVIVEFSPYGPDCCPEYGGPGFNYLQVHVRGTGESDGRFDALGPRTQMDVAEVLGWACRQPWSNGRLGLYGFSASAIAIYNSLHYDLPCVEAAVLKSGTHDLYRDLLVPGGMPNLVPGAGVFAGISAPSLAAGPARLLRNPLSALETVAGIAEVGFSVIVKHPTLDWFWRERRFRGDVNDLPILMIDGFFDVEARGAFEAFRELRDDGARLLVVGAHDGVPAGEAGVEAGERAAWYRRFLRDEPNGITDEPRVKLWLADGDREDMLRGRFARVDGEDWPIPGTRWASLRLDPARSGTASSLNDGSLGLGPPAGPARQIYPALPSLPFAVDPHTTAVIFGAAAGELSGNALADAIPAITEMGLVEPLGLSYTTEPFARDVLSAGPASLELELSSLAPESDIFAVISDVWPDGSAHPVASGRLRTTYPGIDEERSLRDPSTGDIVQPYGLYGAKDYAGIGEERRYHVELWPIGNRFRAGHRLRLHILGASAYHLPSGVAINSVRVGGAEGARLLLPVLPGSDIEAALP